MRYLIRISAAVLAACMASLVALSSASAAVTPLPKIQAYHVDGWSGMVKRPSHIILGNGGAPEASNLIWSRWTATSGKATGKLELFWCVPTSTCKPTVHKVTVWANTPRMHRGLGFPYFSGLAYQYVNRKGITKRLAYTFGLHSGSVVHWE